jgi:uncharacterized membrane protein YfcA
MHSFVDFFGHADFLAQALLLLVTGGVAGLINVTAGGGSMLTLPVLIFAGLDPVTANGTNRVSILFQGGTSVYGFHRQGLSDFGTIGWLSAWALPGAVLGALLASHVDNSTLQRVISVVLIISVISLLVPIKPLPVEQISRTRRLLSYPTMFAIGFYGGFIQIGVSLVFMIGLQRLLRLDLVKVNAHKALIILVYTLPALAVFIWMGQVNWTLGVILAVGTAVGSWLGTRVAVHGGERWIRIIVAIVVVLMAGKLLLGAAS